MDIFDRLERRFGRYAVPNLVTGIVVGQMLVFALSYLQQMQGMAAGPNVANLVSLRPDLILEGQVWRLVTFLFEPPRIGLLWLAFHWYLMHFFGQVLQRDWSEFKLTLYLLIGYAATVAVSFFLPPGSATNSYLYTSLFLAFAQLYPDYTFHIYFVLPVKVKWLAMLTWIFFALRILGGGWPQFWLVLATVADFALFFGVRAITNLKHARRRHDFQKRVAKGQAAIRHECRTCGLTSDMAPKTIFRYCSQCAGQCGYCPEHLKNHQHVV